MSAVRESMTFDDLVIHYDSTVLRPRPWTLAQSSWGVDLLRALPDGAVLELCCGAGHIGLGTATRTARRTVLVDIDPSACAMARANAAANGLGDRVEVRNLAVGEAALGTEQFALILADPPWVPSTQTGRYPDDPLVAIDGGHDGLAIARECVEAISRCLLDGGAAILQLGDTSQAAALGRHLDDHPALGLRVAEVRQPPANGVLVRIVRASRRPQDVQAADHTDDDNTEADSRYHRSIDPVLVGRPREASHRKGEESDQADTSYQAGHQ